MYLTNNVSRERIEEESRKRVNRYVTTRLLPKLASAYPSGNHGNRAYIIKFPKDVAAQFALEIDIQDWSGRNTLKATFRAGLAGSASVGNLRFSNPTLIGTKVLGTAQSVATTIYDTVRTGYDTVKGNPVLIIGDPTDPLSRVYWSQISVNSITLSYADHEDGKWFEEVETYTVADNLNDYTLLPETVDISALSQPAKSDDAIRSLANLDTNISNYRRYKYLYHKYIVGVATDNIHRIRFSHDENKSLSVAFTVTIDCLYAGAFEFRVGFYLYVGTKYFYNPTIKAQGKVEQNITVRFIKGTDGYYYITIEGLKNGGSTNPRYSTLSVTDVVLGLGGNTAVKHLLESGSNWEYLKVSSLPAGDNTIIRVINAN